jgi:hypothetical protein
MSVGTDDVESTAGGMGHLITSNNYQGYALLRSILKRQ